LANLHKGVSESRPQSTMQPARRRYYYSHMAGGHGPSQQTLACCGEWLLQGQPENPASSAHQARKPKHTHVGQSSYQPHPTSNAQCSQHHLLQAYNQKYRLCSRRCIHATANGMYFFFVFFCCKHQLKNNAPRPDNWYHTPSTAAVHPTYKVQSCK
jgi:hypothetical protein